MIARDRSTSSIHRASPLLTLSAPSRYVTLVARASAGPTASCHAKAILPALIGCRASSAGSVSDAHARVETNSPDRGISRV